MEKKSVLILVNVFLFFYTYLIVQQIIINKYKMENLKKLMLILKDKENKYLTGTLELEPHHQLIEKIFDKKVISYVNLPSFGIDSDGVLIGERLVKQDRMLSVQTRIIKISEEENIKNFITASNLFIYSIGLSAYSDESISIRLAELNLNKIKKTFTISENVFSEFSEISDRLAINKSKFVENKIKEFIEKYR